MSLLRVALIILIAAGAVVWVSVTAHAENATLRESLAAPKPPVTLGLVLDGPVKRGELADLFKAEISDIAGKSYDVHFDLRQGDGTAAGMEAVLDGLLKDKQVDVVITMELLGSAAAARRPAPPKPVIAAQVFDAGALGLPQHEGHSGVKNLAYISRENPISRDMERIKMLKPFKQPVLLAGSQWLAAMEALHADVLLPGNMAVASVGDVPEAALQSIPDSVDAVCFGPLPNLTEDQFAALAQAVNARKLFSWSLAGSQDVQAGVLATLQPDGELRRLARRTGIYLTRILTDGAPESLPVALDSPPLLTINLETARQIGLSISWEVLNDAIVINEDPLNIDRNYTLETAVRAALAGNLDLSEKERALRASAQNIPAARSNLLPQVEANSTYSAIDKELTSSFSPERQWTGAVKVTQLIYDEMARANVEIQRRLQESLEHEYAGFELDIIKLAADGYFNVLYAKTLVDVQKSNLHQTRAYLDLARVREEAGASGLTEVYRWEAQIAQNRVEVIKAITQWQAAQLQFNRVLNRSQDELFRLAPVMLEDSDLFAGAPELAAFLKDPAQFATLTQFLVATGLRQAPELQQLDSALQARGRYYEAAKRRYYIPTVGVQVEMKHQFGAWGEYAKPSGITSLIMPSVPEDSWTAGINASLPLYTGGKRRAEEIQARENLASLKYTRASSAQKIEQRIRTAAERVRASYEAIGQSRAAAAAARKNQELVAKGYAQGVLNVIQLVDAQTAQLVAELSTAGAGRAFMLDLMELYRAQGVVAFLETEDARKLWRQELNAWMERPSADHAGSQERP